MNEKNVQLMSPPSLNDAELVAAIQNQQPAGFSELYRRYGKMVVGHVVKNSGTQHDGREVLQITMVRFYDSLCNGRYEERGKMGHYVFQLAANAWREELRRRKRLPQHEIGPTHREVVDESNEQLIETIVKDHQLRCLHRALAELAPPCRDLIKHYHLQRQKLKTIAEELGYDYNNLRKKLFDCRTKLRRQTEALLATQS